MSLLRKTRDLIRLLRPEQWTKNVFVLLPLFFGGMIMDRAVAVEGLWAFLAFCLVSSAVYCINDTVDAESDRRHPKKCNRPIASGRISTKEAITTAVVLAAGSLAISFCCISPEGGYVAFIIASYLVLNILYSLGIKKMPIIDIFILSTGFVLRLLAGGVACDIPLSPWIVIMTFVVALFLAMGKRRNDVIHRERTGEQRRPSTEGYTETFANLCLCMLGAITIVCYLMYTVSSDVVTRLGSEYVYLTSLFVLAGLIRYMYLVIGRDEGGNPTDLILHDKGILTCILGWLALFVFLIYAP